MILDHLLISDTAPIEAMHVLAEASPIGKSGTEWEVSRDDPGL